MLAWEWTLEKARDGEGEVEKKAATRKISQTAQVKRTKWKKLEFSFNNLWVNHIFLLVQATYDPSHGYSPQPIDISLMTLSRELQVHLYSL